MMIERILTANFREMAGSEPKDIRERTVQEIYDSIVATRASLQRLQTEMEFVHRVHVINTAKKLKGETELEIFKPVPEASYRELELRLIYAGLSKFLKEGELFTSSKETLIEIERQCKSAERVAHWL